MPGGEAAITSRGSGREVLLIFAKLGVTAFGGPVAHLGYLRRELVLQRRWVEEDAFADLVGLCQLLPGPASSQIGIAVGLARASLQGAFTAWLGFTLPSAIALIGFAYGLNRFAIARDTAWLQGLRVAAAIVMQTVSGRDPDGRRPGRPRPLSGDAESTLGRYIRSGSFPETCCSSEA